jgi:hypothetical protein
MKAKYQQFHSIGVVLIFCLYHLPGLLLGTKAYFNAFDSLDSYVVWYRMVVQQGYAWAPAYTIVEPFMGGVPKFTLVSTYNFYYWLNLLFPTFEVYQILIVFISAIGVLGMWLLSRYHLGLDTLSAAFLSLSFGLTPFLPTWGLSIAGQPLLLYAILNVRKKQNGFWNWLILGAFPFFSNFQSAGVFMLLGLALLIVYDFSKKRSVLPLISAFALLLLLYSVTKLDLLTNMLGGKGFVSHRMDMLRFSTSLLICAKVMVRYFLLGNIDVALSLHTFVLLPFVIGTWGNHILKTRTIPFGLSATLGIIVLICIYIGALQWDPVVNLRNESDLLRMYSMERFHIFLQLLWHLATAQAILLLPVVRKKLIVSVLIVAQLTICLAYQPTYYARFFSKWVKIQAYHYIFTYDDYYSAGMFEKIKSTIGKPVGTYRVASIGIPPGIAQYNGLWTIDGYSSNYPLSYKKAFRPIIEKELAKNEINAGFFDYWGSQCLIVYDQGTGYFDTHMTKGRVPKDRDIELSGPALRKMHCDYIISTETIAHPEKSGLKKIAVFDSPIWHINLYSVKAE